MTTVSGWRQGSPARRGLSWRRHLGRRALDRPDDPVMRAATAEITVERAADVLLRGLRISRQKRRRTDQDAGNTIATLHCLLGDKSALQRMRPLGAAQAVDRDDVLVGNRPQRRIAGGDRAIADDDIAGAAFAGPAA